MSSSPAISSTETADAVVRGRRGVDRRYRRGAGRSVAPGQYAQAGGAPAPSDAQPIGRVATVSGNATAVRNGVAVTLNVGDAVYKGDVVQTAGNSAVGVIFGDGTTFNLTANARMVLNEFVYNPAPGLGQRLADQPGAGLDHLHRRRGG